MPGKVAQRLKQTAPFSSREQEVFLGVLVTAARIIEPWTTFLKANAELTTNQYNVLRILRGTPAAELPIEGPTLFEFAINLKTARRLGINPPMSVLLRADQVIE